MTYRINSVRSLFKEAERNQGMSDSDLAAKLGKCRGTVSARLNQPEADWSIADLVLYSQTLHIPMADLMDAMRKAVNHANDPDTAEVLVDDPSEFY